MNEVRSKDGTIITYDELGSGPVVILVSGGSVDKGSNASLAEALSESFTVYNYDRRGRGKSGDTQPYAVQREVEDIEALADRAGGAAYLYGSSSGAALALEAARMLPGKITKLALYEAPFIVGNSRPRPPANTAAIYREMIANGRPDDAVEYFMTKVVGLPEDFAAQARNSPWWPGQVALAPTLPYDAEIMGDYSLPTERAGAVRTPTLVIGGGETWPWLLETQKVLAKAIPGAEYKTLEGQTHQVDAGALAPVLTEFFNS